jgi:hypothetical protein
MNMKREFSGWIANLPSGETIPEGSSEPGKPTPWRQLLNKLKEEATRLSGLRLQKNGITIHAVPPKQCDGYYHAYEIHRIMYRDSYRNFQGIGSIVDDHVFIAWVEEGTGNVYLDVRTLEDSKIHTTLG